MPSPPATPRPRRLLSLAIVSALALAGCSSGSSDSSDPDDGRPVVVVTTSIWADVVGNITCGLVRVETLLPGGADPHAFEPSLADRREMDESAAVVANGLGLEGPLEDALGATAGTGTPVIRVGEYVVENSQGRVDEANPHVWFDPALVASVLPDVAGRISESAGIDDAELIDCVQAYSGELAALDLEIAALLGELPADHRLLVSSHDSLPWFADRYGFEVVGTVVGSSSTLAQARPAHLEELADLMVERSIPAIFTEVGEASPDSEALADRIGGVVVVPLYTEALGPSGSGADSYIGLMRTNAQRVADGLA